ncbi:polysaccharide pyruvyl transferase family protein [Clostridium psychrophilum]|uniref:polysaccharide pyruvyl transferase family protein n=1 Tax=Clostridium psychrophilum TaxID=132926 RepID=UPI001C0B1C25|nr:polysaccharide pyruvyl transferase family protein [Clostridium psychrophilum]MBU3180681.1 polysaccharide pyruvyl transferase family protein [Clostridium psychrophilum]
MKVSIITRHAITNYGSLLQAFALQTVIENLGYDVEIIDYIRHDEDYKNITDVLVKKSLKWNSNSITRFLYKSIQSPEYKLMGKAFKRYRKQYLKLTNNYCSIKELEKNPPIADIYCTGSDQVWGTIGEDIYDKVYFLDFVQNDKKCISYAASFGKSKIDENFKNMLKGSLKKYDELLVREDSALQILQSLNFKNSSQVLDPTLLLNNEQWDKYIGSKKINKDYVLIYQLHRNNKMDKYSKMFSKKTGLQLIRMTPSLHHIVRGGKVVFLPNIIDFLSYIKNAKYVITDSFHGTAFAINYNVQFIDIHPGETATRNQSILELTGLKNRMLANYNDFSYIDKMIDYKKVNEILTVERVKSINLLKESLIK